MSEENINEEAMLAGDFTNCCNGRVGTKMLEAAKNDPELQKMIAPNPPSGVKLLSEGEMALASNSENCCNGRVGPGAMM
ncbi:MAG: hypothetical protein JAZ17_07870 [Candidatus Thiodiazotropha endolucinida]|nr:hypothetical protein [Candidatus Thiodiazotropha endolucinida]